MRKLLALALMGGLFALGCGTSSSPSSPKAGGGGGPKMTSDKMEKHEPKAGADAPEVKPEPKGETPPTNPEKKVKDKKGG